MSRSFVRATLTLIGTIIGAGIFALPKAFSDFGVWKSSFVFWGIALIICLTHLMLVDIQLSSHKKMRLAGAVRRWLGERPFLFTAISYPCQLIGASLAYILLGGAFLQTLFAPLVSSPPLIFWQMLFWLGGGLTLIGGLRMLAKIESWATWVLIATLLGCSFLIWGSQGINEVNHVASWGSALGLFGLGLFSLGGIPGIGEVVEIAERNRSRAYAATLVGTLGAALISWIFAVSFAGMREGTGGILEWLLALAGFLAVATSFVVIVEGLVSTLHLDLGLSQPRARLLSLGVPLILAWAMTSSVRGVIDAVGTIFGGCSGILVAMTAAKLYIAQKADKKSWREAVCILVALAYVIGMAHWIWARMLY